MKKKLFALLLAISMCPTMLLGCEASQSSKTNTYTKKVEIKNEGDPIVFATMTDEESRIIGSMMQQVLEVNGYEVDSRVGTFNNTTLARQALMEKQIDLSMDYTGRGMMFIKDVDITKYQQDFETAFQTTKKADENNGIIWLTYAKYNNTDAIAVRKDWAEENKIVTMQDFSDYINNGNEMKLAIAGEDSYVVTTPTCLPGWENTYGFKLSDDQVVVGVNDPKSMVANNTDGILACHTYSTAGALDALDLVVLEDTKFVSPIYSPAPIASKEILEKYPELQTMFNSIFDSLNAETMIKLNEKLSVEGINESDIATDYLKEAGIL